MGWRSAAAAVAGRPTLRRATGGAAAASLGPGESTVSGGWRGLSFFYFCAADASGGLSRGRRMESAVASCG